MNGRTAVRAKEELQQAMPKGVKVSVARNADATEHAVVIDTGFGEPVKFWSLDVLQTFVDRLVERVNARE